MFDMSIKEIAKEFDLDITSGLDNKKVHERLKLYGENKLEEKKAKSLLKLFFEQLNDFLVWILLIAAIVSCLVGEWTDGIIIILIVILNSILGIYQENKADNAFRVLNKMSQLKAKVLRENKICEIKSQEIVLGDIVILETGNKIPADIRLLESINLKVNESSLTGESMPVEKNADLILNKKTVLAERINCVYAGSIISSGRGRGIVIAVGMQTEMGKIAHELNNSPEQITPLEKKLNLFGKKLGITCICICVLIFLLGLWHGIDLLEIFMTAVSLAVAAIPEGLTVVVTVILALGMQNMIKSNAIIKKLSAVETLGSVTVICSDKTGTLTQNKMHVVKFYINNKIFDFDHENKNKAKKILEIGVLCNNSELEIGDPTETCLLEAGKKINLNKKDLEKIMPRKNELEFDSQRKLMSVLNLYNKNLVLNTKGALDEILKRTSYILHEDNIKKITHKEKNEILNINNIFAENAYRVLGFAYKIFNKNASELNYHDESDLIFIGLVGIIDPPRDEAKQAINKCKRAGITVKMITGDHKNTAIAIAKDLEIIYKSSQAIDAIELDNLEEKDLEKKIKNTHVFARVSPEHKVKLIKILKANKNIIAMTGDGVNDAPALKNADIGIAMGITGSDVTKEAADLILTDDNFASIVKAIQEGRKIFVNIKKVIAYLLSCNIGEILLIFIAMILNLPMPLSSVQILFINLITDAFPAFALGLEDAEKNIMRVKPNDPDESLINNHMKNFIITQSIALAFASLISFWIILSKSNYQTATSACFVTLVTGELLRAYSARSDKKFLLSTKIFSNRFLNRCVIFSFGFLFLSIYTSSLNQIFHMVKLDIFYLIISLIFSLIPVLSGECFKLYAHYKNY